MALNLYGSTEVRLLPGTATARKKKVGLTEAEAVYEVMTATGDYSDLPDIGDEHPHAEGCYLESRELTWEPGLVRARCVYAGAEDADLDRPIYELQIGVQEEPIETHPRFVANIGGTPSAPLNGAIFVDGNGAVTFSDDGGTFAGWWATYRAGNPPAGAVVSSTFRGIEAYLETSNVTYRQSYISKTLPPSTMALLDIVENGAMPGLARGMSFGTRNWLYMGAQIRERGRKALNSNSAWDEQNVIYEISRDWRLSAKGGWNSTIYPP